MAIADPAHCADGAREFAKAEPRRIRLPSPASGLASASVIVAAMTLTACARNPAQHELNPVQREAGVAAFCKPARHRIVYAAAPRRTEPRMSRPDPALLEPQTTPNCEFRRADIKAVDPDEWARLRTEYERQCYQDAEKTVRDRLNQLQAAIR